MSTIERHPIPPIPPPPHASPPPPHEDGGNYLPPLPAGDTGPVSSRHAVLGQVGERHHTPVYRVGSSTQPGAVTTTGNSAEVLAALQAWLAAHQNAVAASPGAPPTPASFSVTGSAQPPPTPGTPSDGRQGGPVAHTPPPLFKPGGQPPPPYQGAHRPY